MSMHLPSGLYMQAAHKLHTGHTVLGGKPCVWRLSLAICFAQYHLPFINVGSGSFLSLY